ncbi:uncharacterized protein LOC122383548 isoform X1 [Amphibalanus amphitrite]|uniref:uncharacterized protein LOC122383548 isoform X1 n=1 Tax=Amphibalanus amphitrite TaxID=1232801 RepID=UPI001C92AEAA|nr:uncharacterized protein LOC122383548 isoform X1 [Amphibalanus amphitrite]XP_043225998.1 uncharacterized protein LOC122383548 isoform X1 [Amphibalanus amphitrite]XP_043225999.1 uncharacterized protein LOC122383548 isoform X1 [Amphibalanus amphitrite]XP_043226000.1 uncharacterized protein LOC122383548 isoform X1 [Amphibalanus amphitrite]
MDAIRRNKQIDSLKFIISKCQSGNSMQSTLASAEESKLSSEVDSLMDTTKDGGVCSGYHDQLLRELSVLAEMRRRLHEARLACDAGLLTDTERRLPGGALLGELISEIDQLGGQLASIGENMEPLGWRLLQNKFSDGLDLPYEQHGAVKSLLNHMAALIKDVNAIELAFQKAAMYKPNKKLGEDLARAGRDLCELRTRLDNIRTLRQNCRSAADSSDLSSATAVSALGLGVSQLQNSVFCSDSVSQ